MLITPQRCVMVSASGYAKALIRAQGYDPLTVYPSIAAARRTIRQWVREDLGNCRRRFQSAVLKVYNKTIYTVQPGRHSGWVWSSYTIHPV